MEDQSEFVPYQERSNEMLYNCWAQCLSAAHDKEVMIEPKYFESILTMVLSREDVTMNEKDSKRKAFNDLSLLKYNICVDL